MEEIRIYVCIGTIEGIFTAIYEAWASKYGHKRIKLVEKENLHQQELFATYIYVAPDRERAEKVAKTLQNRFSPFIYEVICHCALSAEKGCADAVYRFMLLAFGRGETVLQNTAHPYVYPVFSIDRKVRNEIMRYREFVRFEELKNGVLIGRLRPKADIIVLLAPHFADRFPEENWILYDVGREKTVLHRKGYGWILADVQLLDKEVFGHYSDEEHMMQDLWKNYVEKIAIMERKNEKLEYQMLPKRYREFMSEKW